MVGGVGNRANGYWRHSESPDVNDHLKITD
jgi:hypothetical protein